MREIADAVLNGFLCEQCGVFIDGDEPGYPRLCAACENEKEKEDGTHADN